MWRALVIASLLACSEEEEPRLQKLPAEFKAEAETIAKGLADEANRAAKAKDVAEKARDKALDAPKGDACSGGNCTQTCPAGKTCKFSCSGGTCLQSCETGSTCELSCAGGGCTQTCDGPCKKTCSGERCK